jgi:hypothetical protein
MTRFERLLLWIIGIFTAHLSIILWALAVLNNVAALQRLARVIRAVQPHLPHHKAE